MQRQVHAPCRSLYFAIQLEMHRSPDGPPRLRSAKKNNRRGLTSQWSGVFFCLDPLDNPPLNPTQNRQARPNNAVLALFLLLDMLVVDARPEATIIGTLNTF
jgi:hypothetical protein